MIIYYISIIRAYIIFILSNAIDTAELIVLEVGSIGSALFLVPAQIIHATFRRQSVVRMPRKFIDYAYDYKQKIQANQARLDKVTVELVKSWQGQKSVKRPSSHPPKFGEYLLYFFLSKQVRINLLGDLEEEFREVHKKFGRRPAKLFYYKQVVCSIGPVIWKRLAKWGAIAAVEEWIRRHI